MHGFLEVGMAIALAAGASAPDIRGDGAEDAFSIPFELDHGHIFVSAFVNGQGPFRFAFDTGASGMGRADSSLAAELSLPKLDETANSDGINVKIADVVAVDSLRLGKLEKRNVELLSRDYNKGRKPGLQPIKGIIARDFFADRLVTIDYPARAIRFSRGKLRPNDPGVTAFAGSLSIPVCFSAGCFPAKVDTGSSRTIVVPKDLVPKLSASEPVPIGRGMRTNSVATLWEMTLHEPARVAGITAINQKVLYAEPSDSVIVIGSDFLKDYVLTVDQRNHLLRLEMPQKR
jgi:predicted aspartyl protease